MEEKKLKRNFKGIWMPKEIYLCKDLSWLERILLAEVNSLDDGTGCYAGNKYFAEFLGCGIKNIERMKTRLRGLGFIIDRGFNGRRNLISTIFTPLQKKGAAPYENRGLPPMKIGSRPLQKKGAYNRTVNRTINKITNSISFLKNIPAKDTAELMERYSVNEKFVRDRAEDVIDYCEAQGKTYKNYKAALRNFIKTHLQKHPGQKIKKQEKQEYHAVEERTSEQQARVNKRLAEMRKGLKDKLSFPV